MSFSGPSTAQEDVERIKVVRERVAEVKSRLEYADIWDTWPGAFNCLISYDDTSVPKEENYIRNLLIERIYVGEHLAELCEILKDPEQRKIWDASLCVKTLLYETRSVRLVKPEFIPILFVTVLYRLCRAGSSTREEAEDEGMHYDLIMEEHVMLAMDLCRVDPDGCKSLLEKSTFHDYDYEEISFDAALDKYTSLQPSQHIITVLGVMMLLMAYPIRSPIIKEFTRTMLVRDRNGLLAMVEGFLSSLGKHVISSPGCTHCGSKVFEKDPITGFWGNEGKLKSCGACRLLTYCSPQCAKLAWKAGHKQLCTKLRKS